MSCIKEGKHHEDQKLDWLLRDGQPGWARVLLDYFISFMGEPRNNELARAITKRFTLAVLAAYPISATFINYDGRLPIHQLLYVSEVDACCAFDIDILEALLIAYPASCTIVAPTQFGVNTPLQSQLLSNFPNYHAMNMMVAYCPPAAWYGTHYTHSTYIYTTLYTLYYTHCTVHLLLGTVHTIHTLHIYTLHYIHYTIHTVLSTCCLVWCISRAV